jgi:hypothetical protein
VTPADAITLHSSTSSVASKAAYVRREGAAGKAIYSRPPGGAAGTASTSASATAPRREKAPGALPLSAEEKQATFPGKLASTFPLQFATLEAATSPHLFVPPPLIIAMVSSFTGVRDPKIPSKGPIEGVLHGFWPAPPPLQVGRALWPPLKVIQGAPVFAKPEDDKRPRVDIIVDHSNILYSFLNWARARPEAVIKDFVGESNGKIRTSKTVTLSGKKVKLDYSVLFTILERGRKVDRRILAGSSPLWQSLEDATDWVRHTCQPCEESADERSTFTGIRSVSTAACTSSNPPTTCTTRQPSLHCSCYRSLYERTDRSDPG